MTEVQKAELHRQYCRQYDTQAIEPGADSTLFLVVVVTGVRGEQKYREAGRENRQSEQKERMNLSG